VSRRWRAALLAVLLSGVLALSACVSVPVEGPVEKIVGQAPGCSNCLNVDVAPPQPGDQPKEIVEGYLRATSNFQPAYAVARQFLTEAAAERWTPEAGAQIYSGGTQANGNRVSLQGRLVGSLDRDRSYTPRNAGLRVDFGLVRDAGGQWRISNPPQGLLVAEYAFTTFYQPLNLYFVGNGSLVPDPIYLPNLRNQPGLATVLMNDLLEGPSAWLKPAVTTAIPAGPDLSGNAVTVSDGIAEVSLSPTALPLNDGQRDLLAAQVAFTLGQPQVGIRAVRFTVDAQPFPIPRANPDTAEVRADDFPDLNPVSVVAGDQLYAMRGRAVQQVNAAGNEPDAKPMPGPFGEGKVAVESLGISMSGTDLVAVTGNGSTLVRGTTAGGAVAKVLSGAQRLLRPQFSRSGEIWAIGEWGGRQRLRVVNAGVVTEIDTPVLRSGRVTAFKISPDGSRLAAIRTVNGRDELGLLRIERTNRITVDGWRPLKIDGRTAPNITRIVDVAWADATNMLLLGGAAGNVASTPYRVSQDASQITAQGEANNWDAVALTVSLATQNSIVVGRKGQTWQDSGLEWLEYLDGVKAIAYPG
jgi:Lipoprotein LpqB beta-propeller domain/Sporulation and spore germination